MRLLDVVVAVVEVGVDICEAEAEARIFFADADLPVVVGGAVLDLLTAEVAAALETSAEVVPAPAVLGCRPSRSAEGRRRRART